MAEMLVAHEPYEYWKSSGVNAGSGALKAGSSRVTSSFKVRLKWCLKIFI